MSTPEDLRARARKCRDIATLEGTGKAEFLKAAEVFEALANHAEALAEPNPKPSE
ncbi:hypothetical protein [Dongia sedimenti]|uniref:Uncharacterized protein n=1 Tax=Dongia sedimenti TaxID=3064282 RepID=A0ABU0YIK5_9PROT|nr:hypothetical protein [Rhodospirillaceae bacterium R-7]